MHIKSFSLLLSIPFLVLSFDKASHPDKPIATLKIAMADSAFIPNSAEGWGNYSNYFELSGDSVQMEIILTRAVPENTNWQQPSLAGNIVSAYQPENTRVFEYAEPERSWEIQVLTNGTCYLKYLSGKLPSGNPVIIPIQTKYKK